MKIDEVVGQKIYSAVESLMRTRPSKMINSVGIVGGGAWGSALAYGFSKKIPVHIAARRKSTQTNLIKRFAKLSPNIKVHTELAPLFDQCQVIFLAIPFQAIPEWWLDTSHTFPTQNLTWVNTSKGISKSTLEFFPEFVGPPQNIAVLSGPSFAAELFSDQPTALVLAASNRALLQELQSTLSHNFLRIYIQNDPLGVSIGGALKNVLAISSGLAHGLGVQKNAISALVTRGIWEVAHFAKAMGAKSETIFGLSGLGDILLSCYSEKSRNMRFGHLIGQGHTPEGALDQLDTTVEGLPSAWAVYHRMMKLNLDLPILKETYRILYEGKQPKSSMTDLMTRPLKPEIFP